MPYVTLTDLISTCPQQLEANTMIVYDGCNRVLQQIPDGITCDDVLSCIDCAVLLSILNFNTGLLVDPQTCTITVDADYIISLFTASIDCNTGIFTIGNVNIDLTCLANFFQFSFTDGLNVDFVNNGDQILVQWLHGMHAIIWLNLIQIDLPGGATNSQVLTWSTVNDVAYRANPLEICCDQIQACMQPIIDMIQNEINIIVQQLCPCWGESTGAYIDIFRDGTLVHPNVQQLNFISCLTATRNPITMQADIRFVPDLTWSGCTPWPVTEPYILSLCWVEVDLSCLVSESNLIVLEHWNLVDTSVHSINFVDCLTAVQISPWVVQVWIDPAMVTRTGCDWWIWSTVFTYTGTPPGCTTPVTITVSWPGTTWRTGVGLWQAPTRWGTINDLLLFWNTAWNPSIIYILVSWDGTQTPTDSIICLPTVIINPYILTICGTEVDLSCLAQTPSLSILDEGTLVESNTTSINFLGHCIAATVTWPWIVNVEMNIELDRSWCVSSTPYILSVCWQSVDLSCLAETNCPCPIPVQNNVFVMKNGNDITWQLERFDLPFFTIWAAMAAAVASWAPYTVIVYKWDYFEDIHMKDRINVHLETWVIIIWKILIADSYASAKVTWHGEIVITAWNPTLEAVSYGNMISNTEIHIELDRVVIDVDWEGQQCTIISVAKWATLNKLWFKSKNVWVGNKPNPFVTQVFMDGGNMLDVSFWVFEVDALMSSKMKIFETHSKANMYYHHTYMQQSLRCMLTTDTWINKMWKTDNIAWADTYTYFDNFYIDGPICSTTSEPLPGAFITATDTNTKIICNDILWKFNKKNLIQENARIFFFWSLWITNSEVRFYGHNDIRATDYYSYSLKSYDLTVHYYNLKWFVFVNQPFDGLDYHLPNGVERIVYSPVSLNPELRHPRPAF